MDRTVLEAMTVAELRELAGNLGLEITASARKAVIVDTLIDADALGPRDAQDDATASEPVAGPDTPAPPERPAAATLDPALAKIRDEAREREARTGRTRHTIARIDPHLIELRRIAAARDAASLRPATSPPAR